MKEIQNTIRFEFGGMPRPGDLLIELLQLRLALIILTQVALNTKINKAVNLQVKLDNILSLVDRRAHV